MGSGLPEVLATMTLNHTPQPCGVCGAIGGHLYRHGPSPLQQEDYDADIPSLTLIFSNDGKIPDSLDRLLDAADVAIAAIEAAVPGLSIVKAYTFGAGEEVESRSRQNPLGEST